MPHAWLGWDGAAPSWAELHWHCLCLSQGSRFPQRNHPRWPPLSAGNCFQAIFKLLLGFAATLALPLGVNSGSIISLLATASVLMPGLCKLLPVQERWGRRLPHAALETPCSKGVSVHAARRAYPEQKHYQNPPNHSATLNLRTRGSAGGNG